MKIIIHGEIRRPMGYTLMNIKMAKFRDQFCARYSRKSAKSVTDDIKACNLKKVKKAVNDALDKKRVQRETNINLTGVIKGKHKRRGY